MGKTLSEWRLQMSDNSIAQKLDKISHAGDKASRSFTSLQANMVKAENLSNKATTKLGGFFNRIGSGLSDIFKHTVRTTGGLGSLGGGFSALAGPVGIAALALGTFASITFQGIAKAAELEQQVADLSAITGIAGDDLKYLSDQSLNLGAKTGIAATDIVESYKLLASNIDVMSMGGVGALEKLEKATITLSEASGSSLPDAADTMSFAINQFKLGANDADRVINTLAAGAKYGAAEIPDLAASLKVTGVTASSAGVSIETTVAAIEALSKVGVKGAEAGTGLRNVLLRLQTENIPGLNLKTDGLVKTLQKLEPKMEDITFLTKTFGMENVNAAQSLIQNTALLADYEKRVTGTSVAEEQAAIRTDTLMHKKAALHETWAKFTTHIGEKAAPAWEKILEVMTRLVDWIDTHLGRSFRMAGKVWDTFTGGVMVAWDTLKGFANWVADVFQGVGKMLNPANWFKKGEMADAADQIKNAGKTFGTSIAESLANRFSPLFEKGGGSSFKEAPGEFIGPVLPGTGNGAGGTGTGSDAISNGIDNITGGGKPVKNITVNIQKLVEQLNITTSTLKEGVSEMQRMVEEAVIRAVRGSEIALSND